MDRWANRRSTIARSLVDLVSKQIFVSRKDLDFRGFTEQRIRSMHCPLFPNQQVHFLRQD